MNSAEKMKCIRSECVLVFIFLAISILNSQAQVKEHLIAEIQKIIRYETEISHDDVPGFSLGVIDGDSSYLFSFGSAVRDSSIAISDSAIYEIGGLTKVFTALLFNRLEDLNKIDRSKKLNDFLSNSEKNPGLDQITLHHLITHTSGLTTLPTNLGSHETDHNNRYANYDKSDLIDYYKSLHRAPGRFEKYAYSHINYALLEIVLERVMAESFDRLLRIYVLNPLDMRESGLELEKSADRTITPGYSRSGQIAEPWTFKSFAGSEGMKSSPRDLVHFIKKMMNDTSTLARSFSHGLSLHQRIRHTRKTYVADAWHAFQNKKYPNIYLHSGKTNGHAASISFVKETKTAVILMTNATVKMDGIAMLVLRMLNDNWKRKI